MTKRASVFGPSEPDFSDLIKPRPKPHLDPAEIREVAQQKGFLPIEPVAGSKAALVTAGEKAADQPRRRQVQRETRSKAISIRSTPGYFNRFVACLDALGAEYSQADGFEKAIEALEEKLKLRGGE